MRLKTESGNRWKIDYWTIFFTLISLILFNLTIFFPTGSEQRLIILVFFVISLIFAIIFFYVNKIDTNESSIRGIQESMDKLSEDVIERFNYMKDLIELKVDVEMLKKKRGQIDLLTLLKILVGAILIYVIFEVIKSFG